MKNKYFKITHCLKDSLSQTGFQSQILFSQCQMFGLVVILISNKQNKGGGRPSSFRLPSENITYYKKSLHIHILYTAKYA